MEIMLLFNHFILWRGLNVCWMVFVLSLLINYIKTCLMYRIVAVQMVTFPWMFYFILSFNFIEGVQIILDLFFLLSLIT